MKGFKQFILETHPDPDFAMGDFDQLCVLAENYAKKEKKAAVHKALDEAAVKAENTFNEFDYNPGRFGAALKQSILSLKEKY